MTSYWQDVKAIAREIWEMFQDPEHPFDESSSESREGEAWMAISNSRWIERKWQDVLGLSKNVPGIEDLGIDHDRRRVYWYPPYPEYEHWWDFVPGEDPEVTVKRLGAAAAMKRDVEDAIEEYDKMRRKRWGVNGLGATVEEILREAEETVGAISMARERASCGEWPMPESPEDYLSWIIDEAELQEDQAGRHPEEANERLPYAKALRGIAARLQAAGVRLVPMPWRAKKKRWGLDALPSDSVSKALRDAKRDKVLARVNDWVEWLGFPLPKTPQDFLMWAEHIAEERRESAERESSIEEKERLRGSALLLERFAKRLRALGILPSPPIWEKQKKRWGLSDAETDAVLEEAKEAGIYGILEKIGDYYGVPIPETPEEILGWLLYARDADMRAMAEGWSEYERAEAEARLLLIGKFIRKLKMLEVIASSPPWVRERKKWGLMGLSNAQREKAWEILKDSERYGELMSTISGNAANMGVREPESVEEWLGWIDYQIHMDQDHAKLVVLNPDVREEYLGYVKLYTRYADALRALGYKPAPMPWDRERLRWEPK